MDGEKFIEALNRYVRDVAVESIVLNLKNPPGKRVPAEDRQLSSWYNSLTDDEVEYVHHIISAAVHASLFGFLAVLDGDRKIDDEGGRYELSYILDKRIVINDMDKDALHDILNSSR